MEAAAAPEELVEAVAVLRFQRGSPHKFRRVVDVIRGKSYEEALMILEFLPHKACDGVMKTLYSAAANASHNLGLPKSQLYVSRAEVGEGPTLKRFQARAKGRGFKILKPTSHLKIWVAARDDLASATDRKGTPTNAKRRGRSAKAAAVSARFAPAEEVTAEPEVEAEAAAEAAEDLTAEEVPAAEEEAAAAEGEAEE